nr:MAG TPA: hypothetical protein [Caudoviricetes sp.]
MASTIRILRYRWSSSLPCRFPCKGTFFVSPESEIQLYIFAEIYAVTGGICRYVKGGKYGRNMETYDL